MSEAYQQKEWELDSLIDNLNSIEYTYEEYKKEVEYFIDSLLKDTKEINTLRNENKRLNNIINELEKEIDRLLERQYESERFAKEQGFDTYLPAKENLLCVKNKLHELKEKE